MAANLNWALACANQMAGLLGQKDGRRTVTLYTSELEVSSVVSIIL